PAASPPAAAPAGHCCASGHQHGGHGAPAAQAPQPPGTIFTCPMHPEVRQDHPGTCPKCGMALEPEMPSLEEEDNPELTDFRRRFWWTLPLTLLTAALAMFGHRLLPGVDAGVLTWA